MCGQIGNLAGWWKFDEGTGTFTADSSGNGNDGTLTNKPVWVTGMFSNALEFTTGSNQWVWVETSGVVTGSFTVSAWLLPKDSTGDWSVVSTRAGTDSTFDLQLQSGSRISADIGYGPYWIITSAAFTHTFTTGSWYYIAYVVTPTNCMAYVNGEFLGGSNYTASTPPVLYDDNYGNTLTIGFQGYGLEYFNGTIDDVRIYTSALSSNDIAYLYANTDTVGDGIPNWWREAYFANGLATNSESCATCDPDGDGYNNLQEYAFGTDPTNSLSYPTSIPPNLVVWWQLEENSGTCVSDSSGNGHGGTLMGDPLPVWTNGVMPGALQFDGSQNYVQSDQAFDQTFSAYTIGTWFLATSLSGENPAIISTLGDDIGYSNLADIVIYTNSLYNGSNSIGLDMHWGSLLYVVTNLVDGTWHHVVGTWDGTTSSLYLDGQLIGTQADSYGAYPWQTPLRLAYRDTNGGCNFGGDIGDVRIYNQALSSNEVLALYNTDTVGDGIPNWWRQKYFGSGSTTNSRSCACCDPEGDGVDNLLAYLTGIDPTNAASAHISGPGEVCSQSEILYSGPEVPGLNYSWSISGQGAIVSAASDQSIFVMSGTNGSFTLNLTFSIEGCSSNTTSSISTTVSVYNAAMIVTQPVSQVACAGDTVSFSVVASGSSLAYQWQQNGVNLTNGANISGATSATLTISNVNASGATMSNSVSATSSNGVSFGSVTGGSTYNYQAYGCAGFNSTGGVSDANGNVYSGSCANVFLQRSPATNGFVCPGLTAYSLVGKIGGSCVQLGTNGSFVAPASGTLTLFYNDSVFTNNSGSFTAIVTPTNMADTYDVVVTGGCGPQTSIPVTLTIASPTATVSGNATICSGQSTQIRAALTGTAPWKITWSDAVTQSNITTTTDTRFVSPTVTTTYTITNLADAYCTNSASGSAVVTVTNAVSSVTTPTFSPQPLAYLSSVSVTVSCTTAGASIHYTTNGLMPTLNDPAIASGSTVPLSQTTILQARGFTNGYCASAVMAGLYQIGPMVVAGEFDSFFIQTNGVVWGWGDNNFAELSYDNYPYAPYTLGPTIILSNVLALSAGGDHTLAVNTNGTVWFWGSGYSGNGGSAAATPMVLVSNLTGVASVAASAVKPLGGDEEGDEFDDFSLVLKTNGTVWAFGANSCGELGVGNSYNSGSAALTPTQTVALSGVVAIAAGRDVSMALCSNGTVWAWGDYTDAFYNNYSALRSYNYSESTGTPMQVSGLSNIVAIALGYEHGMALDQYGFVWTWGWDAGGQLGTGDSYVNDTNGWGPMQVPGLTNVVSIAAGDYHSVAITASGQVYTWGTNVDFNSWTQQSVKGQLGTGTTSNYVSTPQLVSGLSTVRSVSAGDAHTLALGTYFNVYLVWVWGDNTSFQLGTITNAYVTTPVLVQLPFQTDDDGLLDWQNYELGVNPTNSYQNGDGLLNGINVAIGFNAANTDLNSSGYSNAFDIISGDNPFDPSSFPDQSPTNTFPVITLIEPAGAVLVN